MNKEILLKKIEFRYDLISKDIFHKKFDELREKSKEKVVYSYKKYY